MQDAAPQECICSDAPTAIEGLKELGFKSIGVRVTRAVAPVDCSRMAPKHRQEVRAKSKGECNEVFLGLDGRTLALQGTLAGGEHVRLISLASNGTVFITRKLPMESPLQEPIQNRVVETEWFNGVFHRWVGSMRNRSEDSLFPDFPLAGVRWRNIDGNLDLLLNAHRGQIAGQALVSLNDRDLIEAISYRVQHVQSAHRERLIRWGRVFVVLTWVGVFLPPCVAVWWIGLSWTSLIGAGVGAVLMALVGQPIVETIGLRWVLTPLSQVLPWPRMRSPDTWLEYKVP